MSFSSAKKSLQKAKLCVLTLIKYFTEILNFKINNYNSRYTNINISVAELMCGLFLLARPPLYIIIVSQNSAAHLGRLFSALKIIINHQLSLLPLPLSSS